MIVNDLHVVARYRPSHTSWQGWKHFLEILEVSKVGRDGPAGLCLPPVVIDYHMRKVLMYPEDSVRVAPLTN